MKLKPSANLILARVLEWGPTKVGSVFVPANSGNSHQQTEPLRGSAAAFEALAVGPEVKGIKPGDKFLLPREAPGYGLTKKWGRNTFGDWLDH